MKRFLYILLAAAALLSCTKERMSDMFPEAADGTELGYEHDGKVTFGFNIDPCTVTGTKALTETSDIKSIHVAVFDTSGFKLSDYAEAQSVDPALQNDVDYQYTIELKVSSKPRILHFIANGPEELRFGSEQEVIGGLCTRYDAAEENDTDRKDAYWQRICLDYIAPRPKTNDADSLDRYNDVVSNLSSIRLIRNYSKVSVKVSEACNNFVLEGFWMVNYPDRGTVAPYNRNTGRFVTNYLDYESVEDIEGKGYVKDDAGVDTDLKQADYQGFMLSSTEFITPEFTDANFQPSDADHVATGYVYEREKAVVSPLYLIIKGKYNNSTSSSYYKIAMQDKDGDFYAMLRNFNYLVEIESVSSAGHDSSEEANAGMPSGDISVNVEYQDLPNISDGNSRMTVSATQLIIVGKTGSQATGQFWYRYEPDLSSTATCNRLESEVSAPGQDYVTIEYAGTEGSSGAVIESLAMGALGPDNREVTITTTKVGNVKKEQTITITGNHTDSRGYKSTITRTINLVLRDALDLNLISSPNTDPLTGDSYVETGKDKSVVLHLGIEQGLPPSMFPLTFVIDQTVNSLTPDNEHTEQDLPVHYGKGSDGRPTYWFEKTISWKEYEDAGTAGDFKTFPIFFKTMIEESATQVKISNDYFKADSVHVFNYTPALFTDLAFSGSNHEVGTQETFSFKMSQAYKGDVTLRIKGLEPASGSGLVHQNVDAQGYHIFTLPVDVAADETISFNVTPYLGGTATIELSAYLFKDNSASVYVDDGDSSVYVNVEGTTGAGEKFVKVNGQKVYGDNLIPGMGATLTIYIPSGMTGTVTLDKGNRNITLTRGSMTNINGVSYYSYTTSTTNRYTAPVRGDSESGFFDIMTVSLGDSIIGAVSVPVWGITVGSEALSGVTQQTYSQTNGTGWYLIRNSSYPDAHLYYDTNIKGRDSAPEYSSIFGFSSTTGSTKIAVPAAAASSLYFVNGTSSALTCNGTGTTHTFNGTQFSYKTGYGYSSTTYYWSQSSDTGTVQPKTSSGSFKVYPVTFSAP